MTEDWYEVWISHNTEAVILWLHELGERHNFLSRKNQIPGIWGSPDGVWRISGNSVKGLQILFKNRGDAIRCKVLYG